MNPGPLLSTAAISFSYRHRHDGAGGPQSISHSACVCIWVWPLPKMGPHVQAWPDSLPFSCRDRTIRFLQRWSFHVMLKIITKKKLPNLTIQIRHLQINGITPETAMNIPDCLFFSDTDRKIPLWTARGGSLLGKTCEFKTISYGSGLST